MLHGRDIFQQYFIDAPSQSEVASFEGSVPAGLDRLQCPDIAAPDCGILRVFLIDLSANFDGLSKFSRLQA